MTRSLALPLSALFLALAGGCPRQEATSGALAAEPAGYQGPRLLLESPARGAMLAEGGADPAPVTLRGRACDEAHAITRLRIGTEEIRLAGPGPCHAFELAQPARWGLTVIEGEVQNDAGQRGALSQAFLRSPTWFPAATGPASMAESAVVVQIGPSLLDDGDRSTPDDVATLLERALQGLDLDGVVGALRFAQPDADGDGRLDSRSYDCLFYTVQNRKTGFEAWKSGPLRHAGIAVERLALVDGGVAARLAVRGLRLPFAVTGNLDSGCLGDAQDTVSGEARADALILEAEAQVRIGAGGTAEVAIPAATASLVGLSLALDLGPLDFVGLGNAIGDAVAAQVRGPAQEAMAAAMTGLLQERLGRAIQALSGLSAAIRLPPEAGGAEILLSSRLDAVDFSPTRGVLASALQLRAAAPRPEHAGGPFGALLLGGALPDASGLAASALALGVKDDALNQLLHAAWQAGALDLADLALPAASGLPAGRLSLAPQLPPVLMPRPGSAPWLDLGLGDVAFVLRLPAPTGTVEARGFLSAVLPVDRVEAGPDGLGIVFGPGPELRVEVDQVNWGHPPTSRALAQEILERAGAMLLPQLLGQALRPFPLPQLDLAALDPTFAGVVLRISSPQMAHLAHYQFIAGDLAAVP
jgi:hypothetical protein